MSHKAVRRLKKRYTTQHKASFKFFPSFFLPYTFNNTLKVSTFVEHYCPLLLFFNLKTTEKRMMSFSGTHGQVDSLLDVFRSRVPPTYTTGKNKTYCLITKVFQGRTTKCCQLEFGSNKMNVPSHRLTNYHFN